MKQHYFVFCKEELLLEKTPDGGYTIPYLEEPPPVMRCADSASHTTN